MGTDLVDPCCTCNCFPCQFIARSWINVIEQAGVVADTCIRHHLPPQDLSEEDRWKVIDDYAYDYAVMIGLKDRLLDVRRYMEMEMKEQIEEERSVYSEEDFIDGVAYGARPRWQVVKRDAISSKSGGNVLPFCTRRKR
jgi:hypothetical protein